MSPVDVFSMLLEDDRLCKNAAELLTDLWNKSIQKKVKEFQNEPRRLCRVGSSHSVSNENVKYMECYFIHAIIRYCMNKVSIPS